MDIIKNIKTDHEKVKDLFEHLSSTTKEGEKIRRELFNTLRKELIPHMRAEEEYFYPMIKKHSELKDKVQHSEKEHKEAESILQELERLSFSSNQWTTKFHLFRDSVLHHAEEEEKEVLSKVQKLYEEEELQEMSDEFNKKKATHLKNIRPLTKDKETEVRV